MLNLSFLILVELAVSFGHRILGLRVENHPSIDFKALNGTTALAYAVNYMQKEMAESIIENGANVNSTCSNLKTPLHFPLALDHEEFVLLLLQNGASLNANRVSYSNYSNSNYSSIFHYSNLEYF